jgi:hypothetical protein
MYFFFPKTYGALPYWASFFMFFKNCNKELNANYLATFLDWSMHRHLHRETSVYRFSP